MELRSGREVKDFLTVNKFQLYPVIQWGEFYYAQLGAIELKTGVQRIPVINVTNQHDLLWFKRDGSTTVNMPDQRAALGEAVVLSLAINYSNNAYAVVAQESGQTTQILVEDLPFTIQPPTAEEREEAVQQQYHENQSNQ
jgi:hypothetical protein